MIRVTLGFPGTQIPVKSYLVESLTEAFRGLLHKAELVEGELNVPPTVRFCMRVQLEFVAPDDMTYEDRVEVQKMKERESGEADG